MAGPGTAPSTARLGGAGSRTGGGLGSAWCVGCGPLLWSVHPSPRQGRSLCGELSPFHLAGEIGDLVRRKGTQGGDRRAEGEATRLQVRRSLPQSPPRVVGTAEACLHLPALAPPHRLVLRGRSRSLASSLRESSTLTTMTPAGSWSAPCVSLCPWPTSPNPVPCQLEDRALVALLSLLRRRLSVPHCLLCPV